MLKSGCKLYLVTKYGVLGDRKMIFRLTIIGDSSG